jgi:serine phosphatase RsbU (regulator of sigma subunit)
LRCANAGHPPPLLIHADGEASYLDEGLSAPVGVAPAEPTDEQTIRIPAGSTLLLYTDGLVERRGAAIQTGLDQLAEVAAASAGLGTELLCDAVVTEMLGNHPRDDDVAVLAVRLPAN